ncbi:LuxR C-terminal-related transcriptional regulator [Microbulbifer pacificus]|uniref:LuxR C-terminal-related transcriptional regulator n=1 Tax=Microbulbifer pacificus TaxID=407164 RepID=UPI00131A4726|nr:LuxR C-terminal-related transcriptional regulator [Microbulbifer pacificus]
MVSGSENNFGSPLLIAMRLTPPRLADDSVRRERLLRRACKEGGPAARLCLVTAPAGYGKSTFLAQCLRQLDDQGMATAWLTLDEDDNERDQFFHYLAAAFCRLNPALTRAAIVRYLGQGESGAGRRLITELLGALNPSRKYALFLDDYHHIENPQVHEAVQFLLKHLPDNLYLFIGSRSQPPLPLSRLRAAGDLLQLDSDALGFDDQETGALLREANHLQVSGEEVALLQARTGGWAAVLQLAALSMQGAVDRGRFVSAFSGDHTSVSDFLAEEVVAQMPGALADFLRRIAILERFCAPLCAAVSGDEQHSAELVRLRDSRLLVQSLDDVGYWYRLHPLFRNFLLRQLASAEAAQLVQLHRRASTWFEEEGMMTEAIQHAISAGDESRALDLLDDHGVSLIAQGYMSQLLSVIRRLPEAMLGESLGVLIQLTWLQVLSNQLQQGRRMLDELKARMQTLNLAQQVEVHLIEANIYTIDDQVEKAGQLTEAWIPRAPAEPIYLRPTFRLLQGLVRYHRRDFAGAQAVARELLSAPTVPDLVYNQAYASCIEALTCLVGARIKQGVDRMEDQLRNILRDVMPSSQVVALMESMLGVLHYHCGDRQKAEKFFQRGLDAQRVIATVDLVIAVTRARTQLLYGQHKHEALLDYLRETEQLADARGWKRLQACLVHERVRLLLSLGELPQARRRFDEWQNTRASFTAVPDHTRSSIEYWTRVAEVRLLLAEGKLERAETHLQPVLEEFLHSDNRFRALELLLLLARIQLAAKREDLAKQTLREALALDMEHSVIQVFRDEGEAVIKALLSLKEALRQTSGTERHQLWQQQIDIIATPYQKIPPSPARENAEQVASGLVGELTKKELATLALLVEGYSNKEISEKLCVSTNTVKTHLKSAYGKLGVSRRTQAVRSLKQLGIFE